MKKILLCSIIFISVTAFSQTYTNNWIDYNKTYFKFNIGKNGLFRIPQAALNTLSLGSIPAEQFQLWKNGEEVTLYTSVATGPLAATDYIEFWGLMNDGKKDTKLYTFKLKKYYKN